MRIRTSPLIVGALLVAGTAMAQTDSTRRRSTERIPISKETPRVDTLTVFRTDTVTRTITQRIHDTVRVRRVDTVRTAPGVVAAPIRLRQIGGFYAGVAFGAAIPSGDEFTNFQSTGWNVTVPVGWDPLGSPAGARLNLAYSQFAKRGVFDQTFATPEIFQTDFDLKLRYPIESPWMQRFQVYGLGGVTFNAFRALAQFDRTTGIVTVGDSVGRSIAINFGFPQVVDNDWHTAWGWNAGGGIQMGWKRANVFVESRYVHFNHNSFSVAQVPIIIGASWF
jgi:Outer membrane protein beta-barrel domain